MVVVNGATPGPLALWLGDNKLESGPIDFGHHDIRARGKTYPLKWHAAEKQFKERSLEGRLIVRNEQLTFDGRRVRLPRGAKARDVWQAIEWNGWVICLGRTSESDLPAKMIPPFFASELIAFKEDELVATLEWMASSPPYAPSLLVLDPIQGAQDR